MDKKKISIIVPAYNEEKNLPIFFNKINYYKAIVDFEIIMVNDGSKDNTKQEAKKFLCNLGIPYKIIDHKINRGIGGAIKSGIEKCSFDLITFLPCDNPVTIDELKKYMAAIENSDAVIGIRKKREGYNLIIKLLSFIYSNIVVPLLFNITIKDVNWIHLYRKHIFDKIKIEASGIFIFTEIVYKLKKYNFTVNTISVDMIPRLHGIPSIKNVSVIIRTFIDTIYYCLKLRLWN